MTNTVVKSDKMQSIQLLRALAVVAVIISHISHELKNLLANKLTTFDDKLFPGDFGVDLFFVISGFIMLYTTQNSFGRAGETYSFLRRRVLRIVPFYWIATTLMIIAVMMFPGSVNTATSDIWQWITSYFFIPYARESDGLIRPVLGIGWSLQYEMLFYAIFAIGLFWKRAIGLVFIVAAPFVIIAIGYFFDLQGSLWSFLRHPMTTEFSIGVMIGYLYIKGFRVPKIVGWAILVAAMIILALLPGFNETIEYYRHVYYGLPAAMILAWAVLARDHDTFSVHKFFLEIGETSYATYLTHPFVVGIVSMMAKYTGFLDSFSATSIILNFSIVVLVGSLIVGYVSHYILDLPLTKWLGRLWPAPKRSAG